MTDIGDFVWGTPEGPLHFSFASGKPVSLGLSPETQLPSNVPAQSLVEVLTVEYGHGLTNTRLDRTLIADSLRYVSHRETPHELTVIQESPLGIRVETKVCLTETVPVYKFQTSVTNTGNTNIHLQAVSTISLRGLVGFLGSADLLDLWTARNEWDGESRWAAEALTGQHGLVDINPPVHGQAARGQIQRTSSSTWSTGEHLSLSALTNRKTGQTVLWDIEANGPWRWELNTQYDHSDWFSLAISGPTDLQHSWLKQLAPGASFQTEPATITVSKCSFNDAIESLTSYRRKTHLRADNPASFGLVFNDYMNTLMGDPTTEKLLPLIDAAADAGVEYFCIDCGWYDDEEGDWWPSVGAWYPSKKRFGELGFVGVLDKIRERGMKPGLWLEPEVVGVRSETATVLPDSAFMTRNGVRIREHDRYFLDFRSQEARDYLDRVFDRVLGEYGAKFIKWDYNVTPGVGPDSEASSPGEGLQDHTRAHLAWFENLRQRYPDVVFESCSSGAQRQDRAITSRYDLQSTSDQQDFRLYPSIAAAAPMIVAPEQAGSWAYPHKDMTQEQVAFCLINGLSGRLYLSGYLNQLAPAQLALVHEATALYPQITRHNASSTPSWPTGLPLWKSPAVSLALTNEESIYLYMWKTSPDISSMTIPLPQYKGASLDINTVFPANLAPWNYTWDSREGILTVIPAQAPESARIVRITATSGS